MKKRAERPACKPVKAWAVVEKGQGISPDLVFDTRCSASAWAGMGARIVRVEIREVARRAKR